MKNRRALVPPPYYWHRWPGWLRSPRRRSLCRRRTWSTSRHRAGALRRQRLPVEHGAPARQTAEHLGLGRAGRGGHRLVRRAASSDPGGGGPVVAGHAQAGARQQHPADHDGQGKERDADAGEHPGRRRLAAGRPEQHGVPHQQRRRRGVGDRLGQLPADPAPDHAGRERASTRSTASSASTSGAIGPSGISARATGTSVRPKPSRSSPPSATSSGGGCTWPAACRSG